MTNRTDLSQQNLEAAVRALVSGDEDAILDLSGLISCRTANGLETPAAIVELSELLSSELRRRDVAGWCQEAREAGCWNGD